MEGSPAPTTEHATEPARDLRQLLSLPPLRPDHRSWAIQAAELAPRIVSELTLEREHLPTIPTYALAIMDLSRRILNVEASEVVATIAQDPDTAAYVLKIANSPMYRGISPLTSLRDAVIRLGRREVGEVAGVVSSRFLFNLHTRRVRDALPRQWYDEHLHAVTTALTVSALSRTMGLVDADHAFSCGLFLDIGRTFTLRSICALIIEGTLSRGIEQNVVEHILDYLHLTTGDAVLKVWNVPESIAAVCREHHADEPTHHYRELHHVLRMVAAVSALKGATPLWERALNEVSGSAKALGLDDAHLVVVGDIVGRMRNKARALLGERPEATEVLSGL